MSVSRRTFTREFKEAAGRRLELGASVAEVARACEVNPNVLHRWRRELRKYAAKAFPGEGHRRIEEGQIAELERKVGHQAMEIGSFTERVYNERRLHSALDYRLPSEFERMVALPAASVHGPPSLA